MSAATDTCQDCRADFPAGEKCPRHGDRFMEPTAECCPSCHHKHCGVVRRETSADQCGYPWSSGSSFGWCQCRKVQSGKASPKSKPKSVPPKPLSVWAKRLDDPRIGDES
jgi:hypothetical protein